MSEFKVGDKVVKTNPNIKHAHIRTVIAISKSGGAVLDYSGYGYKAPRVRHATPEEIVAGHRIDDSVDQVFKEAVEHGHGFAMVSIEGVEQVSIAHVINPFPCEELGDDSHTESHISPLCKSKDV